jgi:hypothetical protein
MTLSVAEGQVTARLSIDVEAVGIVKDRRVTISSL